MKTKISVQKNDFATAISDVQNRKRKVRRTSKSAEEKKTITYFTNALLQVRPESKVFLDEVVKFTKTLKKMFAEIQKAFDKQNAPKNYDISKLHSICSRFSDENNDFLNKALIFLDDELNLNDIKGFPDFFDVVIVSTWMALNMYKGIFGEEAYIDYIRSVNPKIISIIDSHPIINRN